jgi:hypothetical protein
MPAAKFGLPAFVASPKAYTRPPESSIQYPDRGGGAGGAVVVVVAGMVVVVVVGLVVLAAPLKLTVKLPLLSEEVVATRFPAPSTMSSGMNPWADPVAAVSENVTEPKLARVA